MLMHVCIQAILTKMSEKAHYALAAAQKDPSPLSGDNGGMLWNIKNEDTDDELSIFAGHTRFLSVKKGPGSSIASGPSASGSGPHIPPYHEPLFVHQPHHSRRMVVDVDSFQHGEGPPPLFQRSSHRMSWTAGDPPPHIPRDYAQINAMPPPVHMDERLQYSYSYDRSSRVGLEGGYGWSDQQTSSHSYHPNPGPATIRLSPHQFQQSSPVESYPNQHPHHPHHPSQSQVQTQTGLYPSSYTGVHPPNGNLNHAMNNSELADLGLAARDSRLDERWSSFMQDSGLLDGVNFREH